MTFNHEGDLSSEGILYLPSQVDSLPVPEDWIGLIQRTKRSLLWRWNSMKPVGASCRDHLECATNYCRYTAELLRHVGTYETFPDKKNNVLLNSFNLLLSELFNINFCI